MIIPLGVYHAYYGAVNKSLFQNGRPVNFAADKDKFSFLKMCVSVSKNRGQPHMSDLIISFYISYLKNIYLVIYIGYLPGLGYFVPRAQPAD